MEPLIHIGKIVKDLKWSFLNALILILRHIKQYDKMTRDRMNFVHVFVYIWASQPNCILSSIVQIYVTSYIWSSLY